MPGNHRRPCAEGIGVVEGCAFSWASGGCLGTSATLIVAAEPRSPQPPFSRRRSLLAKPLPRRLPSYYDASMRKSDARLSSKNDTQPGHAQHLVLFLHSRRVQRAQRHLPNGHRPPPRRPGGSAPPGIRPATASRTWAFPWRGLASWSRPIVFISLPVLWQTGLPVRTRPPARHARADRPGPLPSPVRCTASIGTSSARGAVCLVASGQWSTLPGAWPREKKECYPGPYP